ncbi:MAG: DUF3854 domain-containing protein [Nostoc sp.]|uniref:DUF3854 domain-containing protein n=1 Tax=Nostoc sp. TaxID=1180 RepID=UPI002FFD0F43
MANGSPEIPVCLTEGEKKAACLLTLGYVAIALPGIWNGRVGKEDLEYLHPDLVPMAQPKRKFVILFDYETKPKTKQQVFSATRRTCQVILQLAGECEVALLPGPEKGIDDWVVALGKKADKAVSTMIADALRVSELNQRFFIDRARGLRKFKPNVIVNTRYLSTVIRSLPQSGLVGLASDMGTGKTVMVSDSKRFIKKLERALNDGTSIDDTDETPESAEDRKLRVWAIHSENSGSEENVIFIREINIAILDIDAFLITPSLSTGVDISSYHFDAVFGVFHDVSQSATECAQQLWRYRPDVLNPDKFAQLVADAPDWVEWIG